MRCAKKGDTELKFVNTPDQPDIFLRKTSKLEAGVSLFKNSMKIGWAYLV
jgi:hypothetical protein